MAASKKKKFGDLLVADLWYHHQANKDAGNTLFKALKIAISGFEEELMDGKTFDKKVAILGKPHSNNLTNRTEESLAEYGWIVETRPLQHFMHPYAFTPDLAYLIGRIAPEIGTLTVLSGSNHLCRPLINLAQEGVHVTHVAYSSLIEAGFHDFEEEHENYEQVIWTAELACESTANKVMELLA